MKQTGYFCTHMVDSTGLVTYAHARCLHTYVLYYSGLFLRRKRFMNWPIPTLRGENFHKSSRAFYDLMFLVNILRVKFSDMAVYL